MIFIFFPHQLHRAEGDREGCEEVSCDLTARSSPGIDREREKCQQMMCGDDECDSEDGKRSSLPR